MKVVSVKHFFTNILGERMLGNMVKMLKLSILARLISIVAFSSLAGFYSPHELGVFSLVAGAVAIFSSFSTQSFL